MTRVVSLFLVVGSLSCFMGGCYGSILDPIVTVVEKDPATRVCGSMSIPQGSPWCDGNPTYWLVGHQKYNDTPSCLIDGEWVQPFHAVLDWYDDLNQDHIDRHDCVHIDVNHDGLPDVQCVVGAEQGTGHGYNELYLTEKDGSLVKVLDGGGLQKYTTMRTRTVVSLKDAKDHQLMFVGVKGAPRTDEAPNTHRMFKNIWKEGDNATGPYFEEVENGPWIRNSEAYFVLVVDLNRDGVDDLILSNDYKDPPSFLIQNEDSTWRSVELPDKKSLTWWRNVRVADVTGDGIPDLLVVKAGVNNGGIRIYEGINDEPFFNFSTHYFKENLPHETPDLEVLDINGDGRWDIYLVQVNEEKEEDNYCTVAQYLFGPLNRWWGGEGVLPPNSWVPPIDYAQDVLYMATSDYSFQKTHLGHAYPGCGSLVERWDNRTLLLAQGTFDHPGHNLLLQWPA